MEVCRSGLVTGMQQFITDNFVHILCALILVSRLGDIGSTYLVTPKLKLEANPIVKKLGWPFAVLTLFVCLVPYWSTSAGIIVLVPSLLVSASNTSRIWFVKTYGEEEYLELLKQVARKGKLAPALAGTIVSALFIATAGAVLVFLSPDPSRDWGWWFGIGILSYAFMMGFYGSLYFIKLFRSAKRGENKQPS